MKGLSRRQFIGASLTTAAGVALGTKVIGAPAIIKNLGKPDSVIKGVPIGVITYSYRNLPDQSAEKVLQYCVDSGISAVELMGTVAENFAGAPVNPNAGRGPGTPQPQPGAELTEEQKKAREEMRAANAAFAKKLAEWRIAVSMDKFEQLRKMYKNAGVSIVSWKPSALGVANSDAEVDYAMRSAKALGTNTVTVELPTDPAQTKRLADIARKHKVYVGYHQHLQATPTLWDTALSQSPYNSLNCDIGHYVAAGYNAIELLEAKHDRIRNMHIKDRKSKENGGANLPFGSGDTPLVQMLQLMKKNKWKFPAVIEQEYQIPEGSDVVKEIARCFEFCKAALEA
ncbi:MAG: TIM barrel protein [Chryseolinea sp.]